MFKHDAIGTGATKQTNGTLFQPSIRQTSPSVLHIYPYFDNTSVFSLFSVFNARPHASAPAGQTDQHSVAVAANPNHALLKAEVSKLQLQ